MKPGLVYGIHAVSHRLKRHPQNCLELVCSDRLSTRLARVVDQARDAGIEVRMENRMRISELCGSDNHQGCALRTVELESVVDFRACLDAIDSNSLILVLDGVQDPHNLGACLRTADACGVDAVIVPKDRAVKLNPTVRKVAAGGAESVPLIEVTNLVRSLRELKSAGVWIYGTSEAAIDSVFDQDFSGPIALIIGGESSGLRRLTKESCDHLLNLPMKGQVESLNLAVATGVVLYQILRCRAV